MNYTEEVKQEKYKAVKSESKVKKLSFLTAITCSLAQIKAFEKGDAFLTYEIKEENLANIVSELLIELYDTEHEIEYIDLDPKLYVISLSKDKANKMLEEMMLPHFEGNNFVETPLQIHMSYISNMEKAEGYIQGIFAASGSVYFPKEDDIERSNRGYHLEMTFSVQAHAYLVQNILRECKIDLTYINREVSHALYSKKSEKISDALAFIGASGAVLKLNSVSIQRYMNNEINRKSNIEAANIDKTAIANAKYIEAIEKIDRIKGINKIQDEKIKQVCIARLEDRTSSMSALSDKLSMTKSSLNRVLTKILNLANSMEE